MSHKLNLTNEHLRGTVLKRLSHVLRDWDSVRSTTCLLFLLRPNIFLLFPLTKKHNLFPFSL